MIPLIEDYLKTVMLERLNWLKTHPENVDKIFGTLGRRSSLKNFTNYVKNADFRVVLGFPKEPIQIPCYVIVLADEHEVPLGVGDCIDEDMDYLDESDFHVNTVYMESTYRVEVWSDNEDLAVYMYILAKWAMLVSRNDMLQNNFLLPRVSGADLEPVPDYFPIFVYRRSLMISFQYENMFYETEDVFDTYDKKIYKPKLYTTDI